MRHSVFVDGLCEMTDFDDYVEATYMTSPSDTYGYTPETEYIAPGTVISLTLYYEDRSECKKW